MNELDHGLARMRECSFEYGAGLCNNGPMVSEALHALGHDVLTEAFLDVYLPRLQFLEVGQPIPEAGQKEALGNGLPEDWVVTFAPEHEAGAEWELLREKLPVFLAGYFAAAFHGPVRLAHAIRALEGLESAHRREEMVRGLAYWASRYQELPGVPGCESEPGYGLEQIFKNLQPASLSEPHPLLVSQAVNALENHTLFVPTIERADLREFEPSVFVSRLCSEAAHLYLKHPAHRLPYLFGLTGASALRSFLPYLNEETVERGLGYALQGVLAVHCTYGESSQEFRPSADLLKLSESWDEMRYRAACSAQEHVIRLAEACWREDQICSEDVFRWVAADAILELGFSHGGRGG